MKASKFSDAQKAFIIKQGEEGTPVSEICRKAGISQVTYWTCRGIVPLLCKTACLFHRPDPALPDPPVCWSRGGGCRRFAMEEDMRNT